MNISKIISIITVLTILSGNTFSANHLAPLSSKESRQLERSLSLSLGNGIVSIPTLRGDTAIIRQVLKYICSQSLVTHEKNTNQEMSNTEILKLTSSILPYLKRLDMSDKNQSTEIKELMKYLLSIYKENIYAGFVFLSIYIVLKDNVSFIESIEDIYDSFLNATRKYVLNIDLGQDSKKLVDIIEILALSPGDTITLIHLGIIGLLNAFPEKDPSDQVFGSNEVDLVRNFERLIELSKKSPQFGIVFAFCLLSSDMNEKGKQIAGKPKIWAKRKYLLSLIKIKEVAAYLGDDICKCLKGDLHDLPELFSQRFTIESVVLTAPLSLPWSHTFSRADLIVRTSL